MTGVGCHYSGTPEAHIVEALKQAVLGTKTDPALYAKALQDLAGLPDVETLERAVEKARALVEDIKRKRHRLGLALADGVMTADVYRSTDAELVDRLEAAAAQLASAQSALLMVPTKEERAERIENMIARFEADPDWLRRDPPKVVSSILKNYGVQIWCEDGQVVDVILCAV